MTAAVFVDTNVLVYARDAASPEKQGRAAAWIRTLWQSRAGRLSVQILQEYYAVVTRKLRPGLPGDVRGSGDVRVAVCHRPDLGAGARAGAPTAVVGAWSFLPCVLRCVLVERATPPREQAARARRRFGLYCPALCSTGMGEEMVGSDAALLGLEVRDEYVPVVAGLLKEAPIPTSELRAQIEACLNKVRRAAKTDDLVDVDLVKGLAASCNNLLDEVDAGGEGEEAERFRRLTQMACRYFVLEEDTDGDLDSLLGFDDDASVFNAVCRALDRDDLKVLF